MAPRFKAPRGTQDVLPRESWRWQRVEAAFREVCRRYGYAEIRTPLFEETELFARGVGEGTEVVSKQMYTFEDRGGRSLTLRAEGTAPVVRAYLEHNLGAQGGTQKLFYIAPIFRYERPQAGRYRQHHQVGIEAIGAAGPDIDAEVIALYQSFLGEIGLEGGVTHLSSIGCPACRPRLHQALREFFAPKIAEMCEFCQARYETNPLRILDCKVPADVEARAGAPSALEYLCEECERHFAGVKASLEALDVSYEVDPTIVRGLDYYTRTAFEVVHSGLGAKDVLMGGGRYDGLADELGGERRDKIISVRVTETEHAAIAAAAVEHGVTVGEWLRSAATRGLRVPASPGVGFGSGIERLLLVLGEQTAPPVTEVYVAAASPEARGPAFALAMELRRAGVATEVDYHARSLKAQMKEASRLGARYAALLGEDELSSGQVTLRDMNTGEQQRAARAEVVVRMRAALCCTSPQCHVLCQTCLTGELSGRQDQESPDDQTA